jgi:DNA-binding transcriptional MerR regulator
MAALPRTIRAVTLDVGPLTIGAVAAETDVSVDTLRAWEQRHGFPSPTRHAGGHRRYSVRDIDAIRQVQRHRELGMSLESAIALVRDARANGTNSIYGAVRERFPDQSVQLLSRRALLAITRAIEDEISARAERPALAGFFQNEGVYRRIQHRWRQLTRSSSFAVAFADFATDRIDRAEPVEIAVAYDAPVLREWAVICVSPTLTACVLAIELAADGANGQSDDRRFDVICSTDPAVVTHAMSLAAQLANDAPGAAELVAAPAPAIDPAASLRNAGSILLRAATHLDR